MATPGVLVARALRGGEPGPARELIRRAKAAKLADLGEHHRRAEEADARDRGEPADALVAGEGRAQLLVQRDHLGGDRVHEPQRCVDAATVDRRELHAREEPPTARTEDRVDRWLHTVIGEDG